MNDPLQRILAGSVAGLISTVPMTAVMSRLHAKLPRHEKEPLPPRKITEEMTSVAGVDDDLSEQEMTGLTMFNHFGYGAGAGALYAALPVVPGPLPHAARGVAFGLGVWAASYLGWLPAMGSRAAAEKETPRRNGLMIAAHVVWGASLGMLVGAMVDDSRA